MDLPDRVSPAPLSLLGPPRVLTRRGPIDLPDALPGYLLAVLGARGDWVLREELSVLLWPEASAAEAQHNLRVNLTRLRPLLLGWGLSEHLLAERRRLRLNLGTDVEAFQRAFVQQDWTQSAALGGRFAEGLSFRAFAACGEWARQLGDRLRRDWRTAVLNAARAATPAAALSLTDRLDADERVDEAVQRLRLAALVALGRSADAARELVAFRAGLRSELQAQPSPAFETFAQGLLPPAQVADARVAPPGDVDAADALIGRADELDAAVQMLRQARLVTLAGLGGVGKTRLARALLARLAGDFDAGARWLSLAELTAAREVQGLLADLLGAAPAADRGGLAAVIESLGARRWLIVFDNAEHLLDAEGRLPTLIEALLASCPALHLIVTSREPLGLAAERVLRLQGLALPAAAGAEALSSAAVRLFAAQGARVAADFDVRLHAADVARIARLTGGLPLALRVAAGWLRWLNCAQIASELEGGLDALDTAHASSADGARNAQGARGLRATLEQSWRRLPPPSAQALLRLAVFAGRFEPAAARDVAGAGLPTLAELAEVSMLELRPDAAGNRFELHPLVRQFALERLDADHAAGAAARAAHRHWIERQLAPLADWRRIDQRAALQRITSLLDEVRSAWRSAVDFGDAAFIASVAPVVARFFEQKGSWSEGLLWFESAQAPFDASVRAELAALAALARGQAVMLYRRTDLDAAETVSRRALQWVRELDHSEGIRASLNTLGLTLLMQNRTAEARQLLEEAATLAAGDGDAAGEAVFRANVALADKRAGHFAAAAQAWRRSLALHREGGNWRSAINVLNNLANLLRVQGLRDEAQPLAEEGLRLCEEHGLASMRPFMLINLAQIHADAGRIETATHFARLTQADIGHSGETMLVAATLLVLSRLALMQGDSAAAAPLLAQALRSTTGTGDVANRFEALDGYACWLQACGAAARAAQVWALLLAQSGLHAELRPTLQRQLDGVAGQLPRTAASAATIGDITACGELAQAELDRAASEQRVSSSGGTPGDPQSQTG